MKQVKYFLKHQKIPIDGKFLFSKTVCIKNEPDHHCGCHDLMNCDCRIVEYEERFYYEVTEEGKPNDT